MLEIFDLKLKHFGMLAFFSGIATLIVACALWFDVRHSQQSLNSQNRAHLTDFLKNQEQNLNAAILIKNNPEIIEILQSIKNYYPVDYLRFNSFELGNDSNCKTGKNNYQFQNPLDKNSSNHIQFCLSPTQSKINFFHFGIMFIFLLSITTTSTFIGLYIKTKQANWEVKTTVHQINPLISVLRSFLKSLRIPESENKKSIFKLIDELESITTACLKKANGFNLKEESITTDLIAIVSDFISQMSSSFEKVSFSSKNDNSPHLFSKIKPEIFFQILRNLAKNSVDSSGKNKKINIELKKENSKNILFFSDNGFGISNRIRNQLFIKGATTKAKGMGLGLFHAKTEIESMGGSIEVLKTSQEGTVFAIKLPCVSQPNWFTELIKVPKGGEIVILDDSEMIRIRLKMKFKPFEPYFKCISFNCVSDFETHLKKNPNEKRIFLIDHYLSPNELGLDLIKKLKIQNSSILITSEDRNSKIQSAAEQLKIKILSKSIMMHIPVEVAGL